MIGRSLKIVAVATLLAASLSGTASAQALQTWLGGSGNWFGNPNWMSSSGSGINWVNTSGAGATFAGTPGTINLSGSAPTTFNGTSGSAANAMRFLSAGTWTLQSGTIAGRYWSFGTTSAINVTLELDGIALTNANDATFTGYGGSTGEVVLKSLAGSTTPLLQGNAGSLFSVGTTTNFGSINLFNPTVGFKATGNVTFSGTLRPNTYTFESNGYTFSSAAVANGGNSTNRTLTITGTGGITTGTFFASAQPATTHSVWTKAGTGFLKVDTLVTSGTQDFNVSAGSMLFNGTSSSLGNLNLTSGTLGGAGAIGFASGKLLTASAGSFFTANMTNGGLDILGSLSLSQTGAGVELLLSGLLPTSGTTTLMSWTTLTSGSFSKIRYNGTEVTPGVASGTLDGGQVAYTPTSIQFIAAIPVPEPATMALLASGGAAILGHRLRRRRRGYSSSSR